MLTALAIAAQLAIVAHAPDSVTVCDAVELTVVVTARGLVLPRLTAPSFAPFDLLRSAAPRLQYFATSTLAEYRFIVTTNRAGTFTIPPFEASVDAGAAVDRVRSRPLVIVVGPLRGRSAPTVIARARIDTSADVSLRSVAVAETVYVGQQATYEVAVFLNQAVRERLKRNPTFYPPEMQAMLAYDLPTPAAARKRDGSQCFDALVYRRALFPLVAGRLVIPPAQLVYSTGLAPLTLLRSEESHELQTDSVAIIAVEPPVVGRPPEYSGAVGSLQLDSRIDSATSRVGDPMLFTVRVAGTGNVKLFPRPAVGVSWAGLVAADERVRIDSGTSKVGGVKEFDWVLTPRIAGEFDVPPVRYGYFDPARRAYDVATASGGRIRIRSGSLASADTGHAESALGIRTRYAGPAWPAPQSHPAFWLVMALAPLPAIATRLRRREARAKQIVARDPAQLLAVARVDDPVTMRRHYVRALAHRLGCNPEDFTHPGALRRVLRRSGVSEETATRAEALLRELDSAAYAPTTTLRLSTPRDAATVVRAVDAEALARAELPFWIPMLLLAATLSVVSVAIAADGAATSFSRGVSAYLRQDYPAARAAFANAVVIAPASPDAWANYGTASWTLSDTAAAALGWRQGLAMQPDASDLQMNMSLIRELGPTAPGWVPDLPRSATVWLFAALWATAWLLAWLGRRSAQTSDQWMRRLPLPLAACALVVGLVSIEMETRIAGTQLAVVRRVSSLTSDPAIGMDRGPVVGTGEIVRVAGRRGTWTRVEATDDRDGWIASSQLLLLADRRPPRD